MLIGEPIVGTRYSGGGTDGSLAQGVGLPTIDSVGLDGAGAHSSREKTTLQSLLARTQLAAVMIGREIEKATH
jgi:glutamate carboxypeptidase